MHFEYERNIIQRQVEMDNFHVKMVTFHDARLFRSETRTKLNLKSIIN